jgi:hypothetical protein
LSINSDRQDQNKSGAESAFKKKQERLKDGEQALAQYEADRLAVLEKTARLRALRLARDADANLAPAPALKASAGKKRSA